MASHRRSSPSGPQGPARITLMSAAAAAAAAALTAVPAAADPGTGRSAGRAELTARVDGLYAQAERATEKFNGAKERTAELRDEVAVLQDRTARAQERVNRLRGRLGAMAAAQYRAGGVDPSLVLMLSAHPADYLDKAQMLRRIGTAQVGRLSRLVDAERVLDRQRGAAAGRLIRLEEARRAVARQKHAVERKLSAARRLLDAMPARDRKAYARASRSTRYGSLPELTGPAGVSGRSSLAVAAARSAVGAPYAWGASGPRSFDCSGLMQWAYARAGVSLPRTSQQQRYAGRQVPLSQARPGDLVVYRSDASHVGMYVGNGQVVHAPHPGAQVRYDPVDMMPVSGVTRV
ncbi:C40 family peptidase [Streptomyces olivaceiscleroticus]|uniref:C40 family peptidase n=1 Tax=Streptomyces olivaceiscleroticus TaxID=68245 RepID=A0ABP3LHD2_9ACTN